MKKLIFMIVVFGLTALPALAVPTTHTYFNRVEVDECIWDTVFGGMNEVAWNHANPFDGDYEAAVQAGQITNVTLTIYASNIELADDQVCAFFTDVHGDIHNLGFLNNKENCYTLEPSWLDGLPVTVSIDWTWAGERRLLDPRHLIDDAFINWSILAVTSDITAVPAPGAILLGGIGVILVGWVRRRKTL